MKKVAEYIKLETIKLDLNAKDKKGLIKELFESLSSRSEIIDKEECYKSIISREELGSTAIGDIFAIPHAKTDAVKDLIMTVGISKEGIKYEEKEEAIKIFFMFLSPEKLAQEYLIVLAKISRFVSDEKFVESLLAAKSNEEIIEIISNKE